MADAYVDNTNSIGNLTSATGWTFTNGSATVSCPATEGDANNEIANGDYVRAAGGVQWYKVTARAGDGDSITISPVFQQANVGPVACNYNDADGSAADGNAFAHPAQATTDNIRTAGETIYMKGGQTHRLDGKTLVADEDGTAASPITLLGDDGTKWAGGDQGHVTFDFNDTAFQCFWYTDQGWSLENIDFIQSAVASGGFYVYKTNKTKLTDCVSRDCSLGIGVAGAYVEFDSCVFYSNVTSNINIIDSYIRLKSCVFNGGAATTNYGIYAGAYRLSVVEIWDSTFGVTTAHDNSSFGLSSSSILRVIARRCDMASDTAEVTGHTAAGFSVQGSCFKFEDHNQTIGKHKSYYWQGTIESDTAEKRAGGADTDIKITPNSNCGVSPTELLCHEWEEQAVPAAQQTRGVAIKVTTNPGAYPTNTQLYLEAEYYDHAANDTVATAVSTAVLAADDTWVWFPVVFTPAQVQKVRYRVYLGVLKNAESYHIDNALYDADPT